MLLCISAKMVLVRFLRGGAHTNSGEQLPPPRPSVHGYVPDISGKN